MRKNGPIALAFNALVIVFMLAPLLVVCIVAFTPENTLTLPTTEFSLRWFRAVFEHPDFMQSFWNSLWLALASSTLATLLAVPAGMAITRYSFAGRGFLNGLFLSPLIIPHLVLGVALLRLFSVVGGGGSFGWLILAHALIITPYTLRLVVAALVGFDRSAEQAALSAGDRQRLELERRAGPWRRARDGGREANAARAFGLAHVDGVRPVPRVEPGGGLAPRRARHEREVRAAHRDREPVGHARDHGARRAERRRPARRGRRAAVGRRRFFVSHLQRRWRRGRAVRQWRARLRALCA